MPKKGKTEQIGKTERETSSLMRREWQEIKESYKIYGSKPYKGSREDFLEYLAKRQERDAKQRPGRT